MLRSGLKPSNVEQAKFEYSPLGKVFNRGLDDNDDKKKTFWRNQMCLAKPFNLVKMLAMKVTFTITLTTIFAGFKRLWEI